MAILTSHLVVVNHLLYVGYNQIETLLLMSVCITVTPILKLVKLGMTARPPPCD